jgi:polyhydroxybutyrate depolymerase
MPLRQMECNVSNRNRIKRVVLACVAFTVAGLAVARPAHAVAPTIMVQSGASGLCMAATGTYNGDPVVQTRCDSTSKAQWWSRIYVDSAWEMWVNVASVSTYPYIPMCLDVTGGRNANGTKLQVWQCTNTPGMYWRVVDAYHGDYYFPYNMHTKIGISERRAKCLDVPAGSLVDGEQLQIWYCTTNTMNPAQLWAA